MSRILVLGASYGLLPGVKLAMAGHSVTFVGRDEEIRSLDAGDLVVRIPVRKGDDVIELRTHACRFSTPKDADPSKADLVLLAMQEPQLADPAIAGLIAKVAQSRRPCLSIMNLPPAAFLRRLGIPEAAFESVYTAPSVWDGFDPAKISNTSPDPQALRMEPSKPGELTVTLASNFKAAPFGDPDDQALLASLARDMSRLKVEHKGQPIAPPVRLMAHSSPFIPLAKWPMLVTGNYRCVTQTGSRTIAEAVHSDLGASKAIYGQVAALLGAIGVPETVIVPFEAYAKAAEELVRPSSVARAVDAGAKAVERVDQLVLNLMRAHGITSPEIESQCAFLTRCLN